MGLLSKPSRGLLLNTLQRVMNESRCTCVNGFEKQCAWCDARGVLKMEERSSSNLIEGVLIDGERLKIFTVSYKDRVVQL